MKRTIAGLVMAMRLMAQTGPGTTFFTGTHLITDEVLAPYPAAVGLPWYIVRAPSTGASYVTFRNLLDVHSIQVFKNGLALTAKGDNPEYGAFVISDFGQIVLLPGFLGPVTGFAVVVVLRDVPGPTDRLRVSYSYVQGN